MRYLLLIYEDPATAPKPGEASWDAMMGEYAAYGHWLEETGQMLGGEALQDAASATSVTLRDGRRLVTDGPFAETKEVLGGYYLISAPDLDTAIEAAGRIPSARHGTVEIRPILEMG